MIWQASAIETSGERVADSCGAERGYRDSPEKPIDDASRYDLIILTGLFERLSFRCRFPGTILHGNVSGSPVFFVSYQNLIFQCNYSAMVPPLNSYNRITQTPGQCGGRPCIRGMRIRVTDIMEMLAEGVGVDEILADFPDIEREDIHACLAFAARRTDFPRVAARFGALASAGVWRQCNEPTSAKGIRRDVSTGC